MEEFIEKLGWKKIALLCVGASLLGLIILFLTFTNQQTPASSNGRANSNTPPGWEDVKTTKFTVAHPVVFTEDKSSEKDIVHMSGPEGAKITMLYFSPTIPASTITQPYRDMHFTVSDYTIGEYTGKLFSGQTSSIPIHQQRFLVFVGDDLMVGALLDYPSDTTNPEIEKMFFDIVQTFKNR